MKLVLLFISVKVVLQGKTKSIGNVVIVTDAAYGCLSPIKNSSLNSGIFI